MAIIKEGNPIVSSNLERVWRPFMMTTDDNPVAGAKKICWLCFHRPLFTFILVEVPHSEKKMWELAVYAFFTSFNVRVRKKMKLY